VKIKTDLKTYIKVTLYLLEAYTLRLRRIKYFDGQRFAI
jgi:hypothetical protein